MIRRPGGGRKSAEEAIPNLNESFLQVISNHVAGDPMNDKIKWLNLTRHEIKLLLKKSGITVGRNVIRKLLKNNGFVKRKMTKKTATGDFKDRDLQFKRINKLKQDFMSSDNPILSVDTKKKEKLGNLHRDGKVYCTQSQEVYDHDYAYLATGTLMPHGVYDMKRNEALINLGSGKETADFICDSIYRWWIKVGKKYYSNATELLILCDAGGANSYRHNVFKLALQQLANKLGVTVRVCHYPPYASKWNPIEHRVFPHVSRAMEGAKLDSVETAKSLIAKTKTSKGLKVIVTVAKKTYKSCKSVSKDMLKQINLIRDDVLGNLNYRVEPMVF